MGEMWIILVLVGLAGLVIWWRLDKKGRERRQKLSWAPKVPFTNWPVLGNAGKLLSARPWEEIGRWLADYGQGKHVIQFEFMTQTFLIVGDIKLVQRILGSHCTNYIKDSATFAPFRDLLGEGLVTSEGSRWSRQRKLMAPAFRGSDALRHVAVAAFEATQRMLLSLR